MSAREIIWCAALSFRWGLGGGGRDRIDYRIKFFERKRIIQLIALTPHICYLGIVQRKR